MAGSSGAMKRQRTLRRGHPSLDASSYARGAKLVRIDFATDRVAGVIHLDDTVTPPSSYINDVRLSADSRQAFLTDAGATGALIVVDLPSGQARRVLDDRLRWPDTFSEGPDGTVYVTSSRIQDMNWFKPENGPAFDTAVAHRGDTDAAAVIWTKQSGSTSAT